MNNNPDNPTTPDSLTPTGQTSDTPSDQKTDSDLVAALKSIQKSSAITPEKPDEIPKSSPPAAHSKNRDVQQLQQAAQPSHKVETVDALVEGQSPKPPGTQSKRKSNKFTFRGDDDLLYAISEYAIATGVDESEAARRLIEIGLGKSHIVITPKSPPEILEFFVGALKVWSRDFVVIKSRLNAPMPQVDDPVLTTLVARWRSIASELQAKVPTLIQSSQAVADLLTSLNAEKIQNLRYLHSELLKWIRSRKAALAKNGLSETEVASIKSILKSYTALKDLIEDLGIIKPEGTI